MKIYLDEIRYLFHVVIDSGEDLIIPQGWYTLGVKNNYIRFIPIHKHNDPINSKFNVELKNLLITEIQKENGTYYSDVNDFLDEFQAFFDKASPDRLRDLPDAALADFDVFYVRNATTKKINEYPKTDFVNLINRVNTLENNHTIYEIFENTGVTTTGTLTIPSQATIFDLYGDGVSDAIAVVADSNGKPTDEIPKNSLGGTVYITGFTSLGGYTLSSVPTTNVCIIYFVKIANKYISNIPENQIVETIDILPNHNDTSNIQGGAVTEYYHLTNREYTEKITNRQFGDVPNLNYTEFELDGTMVAKGTAITFRDELPSFVGPVSGAAAPDLVTHTIGGVQRYLYSFDGGNTQEILNGSFEIPHDYAYGIPIELHIHWRPSTTATGVVKWFFDWEYSPAQGAPIAQTPISVTYSVSNQQYFHLLSTFGNLPKLDMQIGGKIGFNLRRTPNNAQDTYGADALFEQIALHVPCDTLGSRQIYIK